MVRLKYVFAGKPVQKPAAAPPAAAAAEAAEEKAPKYAVYPDLVRKGPRSRRQLALIKAYEKAREEIEKTFPALAPATNPTALEPPKFALEAGKGSDDMYIILQHFLLQKPARGTYQRVALEVMLQWIVNVGLRINTQAVVNCPLFKRLRALRDYCATHPSTSVDFREDVASSELIEADIRKWAVMYYHATEWVEKAVSDGRLLPSEAVGDVSLILGGVFLHMVRQTRGKGATKDFRALHAFDRINIEGATDEDLFVFWAIQYPYKREGKVNTLTSKSANDNQDKDTAEVLESDESYVDVVDVSLAQESDRIYFAIEKRFANDDFVAHVIDRILNEFHGINLTLTHRVMTNEVATVLACAMVMTLEIFSYNWPSARIPEDVLAIKVGIVFFMMVRFCESTQLSDHYVHTSKGLFSPVSNRGRDYPGEPNQFRRRYLDLAASFDGHFLQSAAFDAPFSSQERLEVGEKRPPIPPGRVTQAAPIIDMLKMAPELPLYAPLAAIVYAYVGPLCKTLSVRCNEERY